MAEKVQMIALSPTMEEGVILQWNKKLGDSVSAGDVLCEVETDKASMEYESAQEGVLLSIIVNEGGSARVGDVIAILGEAGEDVSAIEAEVKSAAKAESKPAEAASPEAAASAPAAAASSPAPAAGAAPPVPAASPAGSGKSSPLARKIAE